MKKIVFGLLAVGLLSCESKKEGNSFSISGTVKNSNAKMVYLQETPAGSNPVIIDSSNLGKDGSFKLAATSKEQAIYSLRTADGTYPFAVLINDTKKIEVNADLMNNQDLYTVSGSPASQGIIDYDKATMVKARAVYEAAKTVDSLKRAGLPDSVINGPFVTYETGASDLRQYTSTFINQASSPVLGLYALGNYQRLAQQLGLKTFTNTEVSEIISGLSARFPQHSALAALKKSQPSSQAPDFTLPDPSGSPVSLSSFRGKYVLVDFWASWCQPCREENPNVVKAYNEFKDKNFTVLGVSLDRAKDPWVAAIKNDNLTWTQVSDLKYWNSAAVSLFDLRSIPYNILVDPKGNVIAEGLRGNELFETLRKYIK